MGLGLQNFTSARRTITAIGAKEGKDLSCKHAVELLHSYEMFARVRPFVRKTASTQTDLVLRTIAATQAEVATRTEPTQTDLVNSCSTITTQTHKENTSIATQTDAADQTDAAESKSSIATQTDQEVSSAGPLRSSSWSPSSSSQAVVLSAIETVLASESARVHQQSKAQSSSSSIAKAFETAVAEATTTAATTNEILFESVLAEQSVGDQTGQQHLANQLNTPHTSPPVIICWNIHSLPAVIILFAVRIFYNRRRI